MRLFAPTQAAILQLLLVLGVAADATSTTPTPTATNTSPPWGTPTWKPLGCLTTDDSEAPVLSDRITPDDGDSGLTGNLCQELCFEHDWQVRFAGVEGGDACWCSRQVSESKADDATDCNIPCSGDDTQLCGGDGLFFVYEAVYEDFWTQVIEGPEETGTAGSTSETDTASTAPTGTPTEDESSLSGSDGVPAPSSTGDAKGRASPGSSVLLQVVLIWAVGASWALWV